MRADLLPPPRARLANVATAAAIVLCVVLAVVWTRPSPAPVAHPAAPLADSGAAEVGGAAGGRDPDLAGAGADPIEGAALWRDGAGEGGARERAVRRGGRADRSGARDPERRKEAHRRLKARRHPGERLAPTRPGRDGSRRTLDGERPSRARSRRARGRRGERHGERRENADRAGGAGKPIPAAPPAGSVPRRQDPPAAAPGPGPDDCCADGAAESPPEFAIG